MPSSPRTIAIFVSLFLASALLTLIFQSSRNGNSLPWHSNSSAKFQTQRPLNPAGVAFATFLAGNANPSKEATDEASAAINDADDGYFLGARVLAYQLLHSTKAGTNNSIPFLVLCTPSVSPRKRARLAADGATVILVEPLNAGWIHPGSPRWVDVLAKLRLLELTQYKKICFIDADTLVTAPLDGVFHDEGTLLQTTGSDPEQTKDDEASLPRTYLFASHTDTWGYDHPTLGSYTPKPGDASAGTYLNAGFFVVSPSKSLLAYYLSLLAVEGKFDPGFPEQNLLNYAHRREGNMPWQPLWAGWNVNWPTERDWRAGARSFHAKYWDGDPSHDPVLKAMWREQRAEMEGFQRGREVERGQKKGRFGW